MPWYKKLNPSRLISKSKSSFKNEDSQVFQDSDPQFQPQLTSHAEAPKRAEQYGMMPQPQNTSIKYKSENFKCSSYPSTPYLDESDNIITYNRLVSQHQESMELCREIKEALNEALYAQKCQLDNEAVDQILAIQSDLNSLVSLDSAIEEELKAIPVHYRQATHHKPTKSDSVVSQLSRRAEHIDAPLPAPRGQRTSIDNSLAHNPIATRSLRPRQVTPPRHAGSAAISPLPRQTRPSRIPTPPRQTSYTPTSTPTRQASYTTTASTPSSSPLTMRSSHAPASSSRTSRHPYTPSSIAPTQPRTPPTQTHRSPPYNYQNSGLGDVKISQPVSPVLGLPSEISPETSKKLGHAITAALESHMPGYLSQRSSQSDLIQYAETVNEEQSQAVASDDSDEETCVKTSGQEFEFNGPKREDIGTSSSESYDSESAHSVSPMSGNSEDQQELGIEQIRKDKLRLAISTLRQAQDLRSAIPIKFLDSLDRAEIPRDLLLAEELELVDKFQYQTEFADVNSLHVYLFKLSVMFRIPEGKQKLKRLVKQIYGEQFSPFPPKLFKDSSKNRALQQLPLQKKMQYFPHYEPCLSGIEESQ